MARNGLAYNPGKRFGRVELIEHVGRPTRKHWLMRCDCGREFVREISNVSRQRKITSSCGYQPCNTRGKTNEVSYAAAHYRIYAERGRAADHLCACGEIAREWAYNYTGPSPLIGPTGSPYSLDTDRYLPMCWSCHTLHDRKHKEGS